MRSIWSCTGAASVRSSQGVSNGHKGLIDGQEVLCFGAFLPFEQLGTFYVSQLYDKPDYARQPVRPDDAVNIRNPHPGLKSLFFLKDAMFGIGWDVPQDFSYNFV